MSRGRPVKSQIRQNVINILYHLNRGYGYQICKIYQEIYPTVTQRSIYYHLRKGTQTGEISVNQVKVEKGEYSWGSSVEKTYYELGQKAQPSDDKRVKEFLTQWKSK